MMVSIFWLFVAIGPALLAQAQAPESPSAKASKAAFEVASLKENKSGGKAASSFPLDRSDSYSANGGLFSATNQPLIAYLIFAYRINVSETYGGLMARLPQWAIADRFDIAARTESRNPSKDEMRLMMQSLLEDRFKLAVHREKREVSVFAMSLVKPGKTGFQLKRHDPTSSCSVAFPGQPSSTTAAALVGLWPALCGDGDQIWTPRPPYHLRSGGRNMSMEAIASGLSGDGDLDLPIVDQTGLSGTFDFILEFQPEASEAVAPPAAGLADSGPTFLDALKDQLGLQLKKQKGLASFFLVDHIEYPSAN